jgi:chromosome segregation ATPase
MSDVSGLEQRITAALDRIGDGINQLTQTETAPADPGELSALQELLDGEKLANAQLEERVKAIKEKQESLVRNLEVEVTSLRADIAAKNEDADKMKRVNTRLRRNNRALRDANAQGVGDPELINDAMVAELDALRVSHESDRAELDSILVELKPLVEGAASARG